MAFIGGSIGSQGFAADGGIALLAAGTGGTFKGLNNQTITGAADGSWTLTPNGSNPAVILPSTATNGLQLYNTADQTTNYERVSARWASNVAAVGTVTGGTGVGRSLSLYAQGGSGVATFARIDIQNAAFPQFRSGIFTTDGTGTSQTSVNSAGTFYSWGNITNTATSGTNAIFSLNPTYNQASGTAANTDLLINRTQTAVGSGIQYLIDAQADSVTRFNVRLINNQTYAQLRGTSTETFFSTENTGITSGRQFWRMGVRAGTTGGALGNAFAIDQMSDGGAGVTSAIFSANGTSITMAPGSGVVGFTLNNTTANGSMSLLSGPTDVSGAGQTGYGLTIARTINQTGTASYTDLLVNRTQTAVGSGTQRLLDLQVGGVSQFSVSNVGGVIAASISTSAGINAGQSLTSSGATAGLGYATGAGGTVTQATSKVTAFTLNKVVGTITFAADALGADTTTAGATWTNSAIAATDVILWNHISGGTLGAYSFSFACSAGSAVVKIRNLTPGPLSEAPVIAFAVLKGVTA